MRSHMGPLKDKLLLLSPRFLVRLVKILAVQDFMDRSKCHILDIVHYNKMCYRNSMGLAVYYSSSCRISETNLVLT